MAEEPNAVEGSAPPESDAVDGTPQLPEGLKRLQGVLEAHNLTDADSVESLVGELGKYKQNFGNSQNEVGELRRQIKALQEAQAKQKPADDYYDEPKPINLKQEVQAAISELMMNYQQANVAGQQRYVAEIGRLQRMPNWNAVKPAFDQAMARPEIQQALQAGQTDMEKVYLYLNQGYLLDVAKGAQNAINQIPAGARRTLQPAPGNPGDGRVSQPLSNDDERRKNIEKAKQRLDGQGVLANLIPDGDPITQW